MLDVFAFDQIDSRFSYIDGIVADPLDIVRYTVDTERIVHTLARPCFTTTSGLQGLAYPMRKSIYLIVQFVRLFCQSDIFTRESKYSILSHIFRQFQHL